MPTNEPDRRPVHPAIDRLGAYAWRFIGIGIVAWVLVLILAKLRLVLFPLIAATLLTVALAPVAQLLKRRGLPPALAAAITFVGFLALLGLVGWLVVPPFIAELRQLGPTLQDALDQVQSWLRKEQPFGIDEQQIAQLRGQLQDVAVGAISAGGGVLLSGAILVVEIVAGVLLALVITFFLVKDGERFQQWLSKWLPHERRELARRLANTGWHTLGGYLRGSALLGLIEGTIIGITVWLVGGSLALPIAVITFFAAFVPFVGAIVAGVLAVLVTLATKGFVAAVIVAIVAIVVQQLDGDILAPIVFGRALSLHPLVILLAITAGAALAGLAGAFLAVPVTAVVSNVLSEARGDQLLDVVAGTDDVANDRAHRAAGD